ncbi:MAG: alanine racemase [Verrucomicrobiales bacterium]
MTCRRAWAEIDLAAIRENARLARGRGGRPIMAVVKADAYGHGAGPVARALDGGVEFFGVAGLEEGIALREAGALSPVFLLGAALPGEREEIVRRGFAVALSTLAEARRFNAVAAALGVRHPVHLSADTGMGRMGFPERTFRENVLDVAALPHLRVDGVCSHLPSADEDFEYTEMQLARFARLVESLTRRPRYAHICNSSQSTARLRD